MFDMGKMTVSDLAKRNAELKSDLDKTKKVTNEELNDLHISIKQVEKVVNDRLRGMESLISAGFLIVALTALGIAIAFLNLLVDVYNSKIVNAISNLN